MLVIEFFFCMASMHCTPPVLSSPLLLPPPFSPLSFPASAFLQHAAFPSLHCSETAFQSSSRLAPSLPPSLLSPPRPGRSLGILRRKESPPPCLSIEPTLLRTTRRASSSVACLPGTAPPRPAPMICSCSPHLGPKRYSSRHKLAYVLAGQRTGCLLPVS